MALYDTYFAPQGGEQKGEEQREGEDAGGRELPKRWWNVSQHALLIYQLFGMGGINGPSIKSCSTWWGGDRGVGLPPVCEGTGKMGMISAALNKSEG